MRLKIYRAQFSIVPQFYSVQNPAIRWGYDLRIVFQIFGFFFSIEGKDEEICKRAYIEQTVCGGDKSLFENVWAWRNENIKTKHYVNRYC